MTDAMEVLFSYAQEWLEKPLLLLEPEYQDILRHADSQEQRLRAVLNDEANALLESLLEEKRLLLLHHEQALFRAGFQIAMELGR